MADGDGPRYNLTAAKAWYCITYGASATVYPFISIYFHQLGFSAPQIGLLFAIRPWITALTGNVWAGIADTYGVHRKLFIASYVVSSLLRFSLSLVGSFPLIFAIMVATEITSSPVPVLMDASVMVASQVQGGEYGKTRLWGAVGWGGFSPLGGLLVDRVGEKGAFWGNLVGCALGLLPTLLSPVQALTDRSLEEAGSQGSTPAADAEQLLAEPAGAPIASDLITLSQQQPQQPSLHGQGGALSKPQSKGVHGQHSNGGEHSDQAAQQVRMGGSDAGGAGSSTDSTQSSPRREPRLPSLPHDRQQPEISHAPPRAHSFEHGRVASLTQDPHQQQQQHPEISHASPQALKAMNGSPASNAASNDKASKGASQAPAVEQEATMLELNLNSNSSVNLGPRPRPGRRRTSSEERRLSGQSPHSMWEHMPIASVPEFQVWDAHMFAPMGCATQRKLLHADWTGMSQCLHTTGSEDVEALLPEGATDDDAGRAGRRSLLQRMRVILGSPEVSIFLVMAVLFGVGMGTIDGFMFLYLKQLGGSEGLMGLCIFTMCLAEAPIFHFTESLFALIPVPIVLHIVLGVYVLRLFLYAGLGWAGTPWAVLPIELLHGITFGCAWAAGTLNCSRIAPRGLEATTQALFNGLYMGVGLGLGGLVGGFLYDAYGAQRTFVFTASFLAFGWLCCALAQACLLPKRTQKEDAGVKSALISPLVAGHVD